MLRGDGAAIAIGLRVVGGDTELPGIGVIPEIVVERVILLAGNQDMLDGIGAARQSRGRHLTGGQNTRVNRQSRACHHADVAQRSPSRLTLAEPVSQIHVYPFSVQNMHPLKKKRGRYQKKRDPQRV